MLTTLIECLVYNVPDTCFNLDEGTYYRDVKEAIASAWRSTKPDVDASGLFEVNGMKPLFSGEQVWSQGDANAFLAAAWNHVGFG